MPTQEEIVQRARKLMQDGGNPTGHGIWQSMLVVAEDQLNREAAGRKQTSEPPPVVHEVLPEAVGFSEEQLSQMLGKKADNFDGEAPEPPPTDYGSYDFEPVLPPPSIDDDEPEDTPVYEEGE